LDSEKGALVVVQGKRTLHAVQLIFLGSSEHLLLRITLARHHSVCNPKKIS
jgi:hypothetical protein